MTDKTKTRIPAPIYAAAGAGELAYERLRQLPTRVAELRERAATTDLRGRAIDALRSANIEDVQAFARRNAAALRDGAVEVYGDLVARGERVIGRTDETAEPRPAIAAKKTVKKARTATTK